MTGRERVVAAIEHRTPDRLPVDLGGSIMSGISVFALGQLRAALELPPSKENLEAMIRAIRDSYKEDRNV